MITRLILVLLFSSNLNAACLDEYDRSDYPHWLGSENYKDIRQEVIAKSVVSGLVVKRGRVISGLWYDAFTGQNYQIKDVKPDVDHLISLAWLHDRGGACMSRTKRAMIANDPLNLWPVHPSANRQKGSNVTGWLPSNLGVCGRYLKRLKSVVEKYDLKLTKKDIKSYNVLVVKCEQWQKGIIIEKESSWFKSLFQ